jgi:hypothetical protein
MRQDVRVPNESDGFVFTSAALRGRGISPGDAGWADAANAGDLLPLGVESEDSAIVRVVANEPLTADELREWVGVLRGGLRVSDGRLALCGGIAYLIEPDDWALEFVRVVEVPAGSYRATVYCYASAPNGRWCVEKSGTRETLGAWFRRTQPGQEMPRWLHNLCVNNPDEDPGHRAKWKRAKLRGGAPAIDFLLHLESVSTPPANAINDEGFLEAGECRRPDPFPRGIPAVGIMDEEEPAEAEPAPPPMPVVSGPGAIAPLQPVEGGPVSVPVAKLARVARIAWWCQPYTHPAVRVTFPGKAPKLEDIEDATLKTKGPELAVSFDDTGQPAGAADPLTALGNQLAAIANGAMIELELRRLRSNGPLGAHRYRGTVRDGVWQIDAASPRVNAATLAEAIALGEALEGGRKLVARDASEAERIEARVRRTLADYFGANALQRTGAELALKRRDPALFGHLVARVFWMRYADVWPLQDDDQA